MDEVEHQKQCDQDENEAGGEGRKLGDTADAHGPVNDHFSVFRKLKALIQQAEMKSLFIQADVKHIDDVLDDFTEGQRYDGQIITLQTKHRNAYNHTREGGADSSDHHGNGQAQGTEGNGVSQTGGDHDAGEGAHGHKARMPQGKLAQDTNGKVQGNGHHHIGADGNELAV